MIEWQENGQPRRALWRAANGAAPPRRVVLADDRLDADSAYRLACEGTALLWRGDFQNARQLLQALARRAERRPRKSATKSGTKTATSTASSARAVAPVEAFNLYRQERSQRARTLAMLLLPLDAGYGVPLRRAPDVARACEAAYGPASEPSVVSLRELLGVIGAYEWRKKGVEIPALGARIHPHYGVFSPVRGEYVQLVGEAPLPAATRLAFDVGTGTGVLAALLAARGIERVIATDLDPRALACARENVERLGLGGRIEVVQADLFPAARAGLIVCNPPWLPARPASPLEHAVYDPQSRMLIGFLRGLREHLEPGGEGWLILSDLAEHLGLRSRDMLLAEIAGAGLAVVARHDTRPIHPRAADRDDPLHAARAAEVTSLWRLKVAEEPAP